MVVPNTKHMIFRIRTCRDASIALFEEEGSDTFYEIVLGLANVHSEIRRRPNLGTVALADTLMMFDCYIGR